jgi:hypothetical protein
VSIDREQEGYCECVQRILTMLLQGQWTFSLTFALSMVRENIVFINMFRRSMYDGPVIAPLLIALLLIW